jgi:hypothetical protein
MAASRGPLLELDDYCRTRRPLLELDDNCLNNQPANTINDSIDRIKLEL